MHPPIVLLPSLFFFHFNTGHALFKVRSASLNSISTAVSLSTCHNGSVPSHSPSMDNIHPHHSHPSGGGGKKLTKQVEGCTYVLLETASTDAASLMTIEERRDDDDELGESGREEKGKRETALIGDKCEESGEVSGKKKGSGSSRGEKTMAHLTSSLPVDVERRIGRPEVAHEPSANSIMELRTGQPESKHVSHWLSPHCLAC